MPVKIDASGRRSVHVELVVPGSPEEVWRAIASGPGISSWFVPTTFEGPESKPVAVSMNFGPGMDSRSEICGWQPPQKWAALSDGWVPGSPPILNEWQVQAGADGSCTVRIGHSFVASTDEWDHQLQATELGWPAFFRTLHLYLTHFRGQHAVVMKWMLPAQGTEAQVWQTLRSALGLQDARVGQRCQAPAGVPAGVPAFGGVLEHLSQNPNDALLHNDQPWPGVAAFGTADFGGQSMVGLSFYVYGADAAATVKRETPRWQAWIDKLFPTPVNP